MGQTPPNSGDPPRKCLTGQDYLTLKPRIHHYIKGQVKHDAEDLTADVFKRALVAQSNGHGYHTHLIGWLYQIARSVITDYYRTRQREPIFEPLSTVLSAPSHQNVETETLLSIEATHLTAHLTESEHELLDRLQEGYTGPQLGAYLDITPLAARQRARRLRISLRKRWNR